MIRVFSLSAASIAALAIAAAPALAAPASCLFEIGGRTVFDGGCQFLPTGGDFQVAQTTGPTQAYVERQPSGRHTLSWNSGASGALDPLGEVVRRGACWQNSNARLCVWKPMEGRFFVDEKGNRFPAIPSVQAYTKPSAAPAAPPASTRDAKGDLPSPTPSEKLRVDSAVATAIAFTPFVACLATKRDEVIKDAIQDNPPDASGGVEGQAVMRGLGACIAEAQSAQHTCERDLQLTPMQCTIVNVRISSEIIKNMRK